MGFGVHVSVGIVWYMDLVFVDHFRTQLLYRNGKLFFIRLRQALRGREEQCAVEQVIVHTGGN
jgi:hypothetical protein